MMRFLNLLKTKVTKTDYKSLFHNFITDYFKFPIYIIFHPFKGFDDFKLENRGKFHVAIVYLLMFVLAQAIALTSSGFLLINPNIEDFSIVRTFLLVIVPVVLITIGNWSITSLFDGKGKLNEIFMIICYALIPMVWFGIPLTIISNYLIMEELAFYIALNSISVFLTGYMVIFGLLVTHEYGLLKTFVTILFTAVAVGVIIFIGLLIVTLFQHVYSFVEAVYEELIMRISS